MKDASFVSLEACPYRDALSLNASLKTGAFYGLL